MAATRGEKWGHLFARWEGPDGERFNIEGTNKGLTCHPDDYYRTGRFQIKPDDEQAGCWLRPMTPKHELAEFLGLRGHRWLDCGNYRRAVEAFASAFAAFPENQAVWNTMGRTFDGWHAELCRRGDYPFPQVVLQPSAQQLPEGLPAKVESDFCRLQVVENLLNDPEFDRTWWAPLRTGVPTRQFPSRVLAVFYPGGACNLRFHFDAVVPPTRQGG